MVEGIFIVTDFRVPFDDGIYITGSHGYEERIIRYMGYVVPARCIHPLVCIYITMAFQVFLSWIFFPFRALICYLLTILSFTLRPTDPVSDGREMPIPLVITLQVVIITSTLSDVICFASIWITLKGYRRNYDAIQAGNVWARCLIMVNTPGLSSIFSLVSAFHAHYTCLCRVAVFSPPLSQLSVQ